MNEDKTGGPAFPSSYFTPSGPVAYDDNHGMTLRDWFAGMAVQGLFAARLPPDVTFEEVSSKAYRMADAMIRNRQ